MAVGLGATGSDGVVGAVLRFDRQSITWFAVVLAFSAVVALIWVTPRARAARSPEPAHRPDHAARSPDPAHRPDHAHAQGPDPDPALVLGDE